MKKIILLFLPLIILLFLARIDDDLSEQSRELLGRLDNTAESKAYFYLNGLFANENEEPSDVGKFIFDEQNKRLNDKAYKPVAYPRFKKIPLPSGDAFCKPWEPECFAYLFSDAVNSERLLSDNHILVSRSNRFYDFNEYSTLSVPAASEQLPPYNYLVAAERIKLIRAIDIFNNGDNNKAIDLVLQQFSTLRNALSLQDNIIGKVVFLSLLSDTLDIYSLMLSREPKKVVAIPNLSNAEKSLYTIVAREFFMSHSIFTNLEQNADFLNESGMISKWLTRFVYKPNMTVNALAPIYFRLESLSHLSPTDFAKEMKREIKIETNSELKNNNSVSQPTSKLRNYTGSILLSTSPNLDRYVAHFFALDAKLALFNQLHNLQLEPSKIKTPYYDEAAIQSDGALCFTGLLEEATNLRCLKIEI